jgi:hypothetical protein
MALHFAPHDEDAPAGEAAADDAALALLRDLDQPSDPDDDDSVDYPDPEDVDLDEAPPEEGDDHAADDGTKELDT